MENLIEIFGRETIIEILRERTFPDPPPTRFPEIEYALIHCRGNAARYLNIRHAQEKEKLDIEQRELDDLARRFIDHLQFLPGCDAVSRETSLGILASCQDTLSRRRRLLTRYRFMREELSGRVRSRHELDASDFDQARQAPLADYLTIPKNRLIPCLFHEERTPSMRLWEDHFHCFGCGAHGTTIDIVMKLLGFDFMNAVRYIIKR